MFSRAGLLRWFVLPFALGLLLASCGSSEGSGPVAKPITLITSVQTTDALYGVSCLSPSECLASGQAGDQAEFFFGSIQTLHQIEGPTLPSAAYSLGHGVSCPSSSGACMVDGTDGANAFLAEYSDGSWEKPLLIRAKTMHVAAVSPTSLFCTSPTTCVLGATLTSKKTGQITGAILDADHGHLTLAWRLVPKKPEVSSGLYGVSCTTRSFCVAVGSESTLTGISRPVIATSDDNGIHWTKAGLHRVPTGSASLNDVSCSGPGNCLAVGWRSTSTVTEGVLAVLRNGPWHFLNARNPIGGGHYVSFSSVRCSPSSCTIAGSGYAGSYALASYSFQSANLTFLTTPSALSKDVETGADLNAIWCTPSSGHSCIAVGSVHNATKNLTLNRVISNASGTWERVEVASPAEETKSGDINSLFCLFKPARCAMLTEGPSASYILTGTSLEHLRLAVRIPPGTDLDNMTCTKSGTCVVVGQDHFQPLIESFDIANPKVSLKGVSSKLPDGGRMKQVVCSTTDECFALGVSYSYISVTSDYYAGLDHAAAWGVQPSTLQLQKLAVPVSVKLQGKHPESELDMGACHRPRGNCVFVGVVTTYRATFDRTFSVETSGNRLVSGPPVPPVPDTTYQGPSELGCGAKFCVLLEQPTLDSGKTTLAAFLLEHDTWHALRLSKSISTRASRIGIDAVSCWSAACLVGAQETNRFGVDHALMLRVAPGSVTLVPSPRVSGGPDVTTSVEDIHCGTSRCHVALSVSAPGKLQESWIASYKEH